MEKSSGAKEWLVKVAEWLPSYSQVALGALIMLFGLISYVGGDVFVLLNGQEDPTQVLSIPRLDEPRPQLIMLFAAWFALVPSRVNGWLFYSIKRLVRGEDAAEPPSCEGGE